MMNNVWMIASGKGGVGKSTLAAALAVALARAGKKTAVVDMDLGLRSLDIHLGMENTVVFSVMDYVHGDCKLMQAVLMHLTIPGLGLLPASQLHSAEAISAEQFARILLKLQKRFDVVLVDAPAGLSRAIETILECAENSLLVVTPDDVSIRDAERFIALCRDLGKPAPMIVANRVIPELVASGDQVTPQTMADTLDVPLLGYIPEDLAVLKALSKHHTVMELDCPARYAVERIARRLTGQTVPMEDVAAPPPKKPWWKRAKGGKRQ